jgi:hypothetical protein
VIKKIGNQIYVTSIKSLSHLFRDLFNHVLSLIVINHCRGPNATFLNTEKPNKSICMHCLESVLKIQEYIHEGANTVPKPMNSFQVVLEMQK